MSQNGKSRPALAAATGRNVLFRKLESCVAELMSGWPTLSTRPRPRGGAGSALGVPRGNRWAYGPAEEPGMSQYWTSTSSPAAPGSVGAWRVPERQIQ
jgi:hypothetical protein